MSVLSWTVSHPTQPQSRVWRRSEVMKGFSLPSLPPGKDGAGPLCLGSPGFQQSPDRRALRRHVWTHTGLGAATGQPSGATFLRAGGTLLGLEGSFVPSEWVSVDHQVSDRTDLDFFFFF